MSTATPDDPQLLIRCPSCGQRFKVGEDLRQRTVECGGCEHRFRINDDVIVRAQRFYPGERKDSKLDRFQRVPLAIAVKTNVMKPTRYAEVPDLTKIEPPSPQRIMAGLIGVSGMVCMALFLIFGARRGGPLDGMPTDHRLLMAGFTGLLGIVLLVYANPRARFKTIGVGALMSAGLLMLPFFFTEGSVALAELALATTPAPPQPESTEGESTAQLRNLIGTAPLEAEIARLAKEDASHHAVGLWLRGMKEQNRLLVRDYLLRVTGADPQSHYYSRGNGDFLMVITGTPQSLDEVAGHAAVLGQLEKIYPEIAVAEIRINNASFAAVPIEQLTDKRDPAFYELNKKELESIDLDRVQRAVQRLAEVEPKIYRSDITRQLLVLLATKGVEFKGDLCRALAVWSESAGPAGDAALKEVNGLLARKGRIPPEMITLIIKEKNLAILPVLDELWFQNPSKWESIYQTVGPAAEPTLLRRFAASEGMLRQSVVRLLGQVGGADSLPPLEAALPAADAELRVLLAKSISAIRGR